MKNIFFMVTLFFWIFCSVSYGESAKEAFRGLKKLEARCQAGISYKDYGAALGDAKFEVNIFLESPEAKARPQLTDSIIRAMMHYENARHFWEYKFSGYSRNYPEILPYFVEEEVFRIYPEANKEYKDGGALMRMKEYDPESTKVHISCLLSFIWNEASKELKKAAELLAQK
ncbi:MAG: hypothetical protein ABSB32_10420 [Thermodesulfobacteriota bacterium]